MSRVSWFVVAVLILAGLVATYFNRSAHSEWKPFLGKWNGGFEVSSGPGGEKAHAISSLKGFVVLYGARQKFNLELSGVQQDISITGTWKVLKPTRVELQSTDIKIDDHGGPTERDSTLPYIPNEAVTAAYSKPLILDLSADKQRLEGLLISVGELTGKHVFLRVGSGM